MSNSTPLEGLKEAALNLRRLADQHEAGLVLFPALPPYIDSFARCSASLARTSALALEEAINLHLSTYAAADAPQPYPRPRLTLIRG